MIKTFPYYDIHKNDSRGCFEVVRWDTAMQVETVETNLLSRGKAYQAMFTWRARARAEGAKNDR
jgi:hypothetical protein